MRRHHHSDPHQPSARLPESEVESQYGEAPTDPRDVTRTGQRANRGRDPGEPDTRSRIQKIAVELFTANGYEATSLREIAERLGVTKAALYYHFKTKDDIIDSLVRNRVARLEELITWAKTQPRTVATRRAALLRYSDMLQEHGDHSLMRFFERNQSSMTQHRAGVIMREQMTRLLDVLSDKQAPLPEQIRWSLAIFALHSAWFTVRDPQITDDQRRAAALEVAMDLIDRPGAGSNLITGNTASSAERTTR